MFKKLMNLFISFNLILLFNQFEICKKYILYSIVLDRNENKNLDFRNLKKSMDCKI